MSALLGPLVALLTLGTLLALVVLQRTQNRRAVLRRVLERIRGTLLPGPQLAFSDVVEGEHLGRPLRLRLSTRFGPGERYPLEATLGLHHAPAVRLRIRREEGLAAVEKALGLVRDVEVAGGGVFDRRYLVEADAAPAEAPLADQAVRAAVHALLTRWDLDELELRDGRLRVRGASRRSMGARLIHELLDALGVLAHAYDRRPALEIGLQARFVWTGGEDARPRCPYCHDVFADKVGLVACSGCSTLLHQECHEENGGCPILGCGGRTWEPMGPLAV